MKVLWLVSSILPQAAQACGLPGDTVSGIEINDIHDGGTEHEAVRG